jgi:hypothetical protein
VFELYMDHIQEHRQEKIGDKNQDVACHYALGRRAADARGSARSLHPFIAADGDHKHPEDKRFDHPGREIKGRDMDFHRLEIDERGEIEIKNGDEISPENPHHDAEKGQ